MKDQATKNKFIELRAKRLSFDKISKLRPKHPVDEWDFVVQKGRIHRSVYTDEAMFKREMTNVFGTSWVFVGHESEIPENNSFVTRNPLVVF